MKLLLLLAFVASAYSAYFEPGEKEKRQYSTPWWIPSTPEWTTTTSTTTTTTTTTTTPPNATTPAPGGPGGPGGIHNCGWGDPQIMSFDGEKTSYQGHCTYIITRDNCENGFPSGTPTFTVYADFYPRGTKYTWIRQVYIEVYGKVIRMTDKFDVFVNNAKINSFPRKIAPGITIRNSNEVDVDVGLKVVTNYHPGAVHDFTYMITVTDSYRGKVCGLAGDADGFGQNDFVVGPHPPCAQTHTPGEKTNNKQLHGESWATDKFPDIDATCSINQCNDVVPPHPCVNQRQRQQAERVCNVIRDTRGMFQACHHHMTRTIITNYFEACIYDVCAVESSIVVNHVRHLVEHCQAGFGVVIKISDPTYLLDDMKCTIRSGGLVNTFDGLNLEITKEQKTLMSRWDPSAKHNCRFQVRVVTTFDCDWDPPHQLLPLMVDWIGVGFDTKAKTYFGRRNILLSQQLNQVRIRGQNINTYVNTFPAFVELSDKTGVAIDHTVVKGQVEFSVRSSVACQWGVDWRPNTRKSEVDVIINKRYSGQMEGMCGNADGNAANDWKTCKGKSVTPGVKGSEKMTDDCREGKNQGQGIEGCTRTK